MAREGTAPRAATRRAQRMRDATLDNMIPQNEFDMACEALIPLLGITFGLMFFVGLL